MTSSAERKWLFVLSAIAGAIIGHIVIEYFIKPMRENLEQR